VFDNLQDIQIVYFVIVYGCPRAKQDYFGDPGVDNVKMKLQDVTCEGMEWIELAQDRDRWRAHVSAVMNRQVP